MKALNFSELKCYKIGVSATPPTAQVCEGCVWLVAAPVDSADARCPHIARSC